MGENSQKKYIPRRWDKEVSEFLQDSSANKNVLLVEGARQVGKSSLVCNALANVGCVSYSLNLERNSRLCSLIDDCRDFKDFEGLLRDRVGFDPAKGEAVFIDEAQESRRLGGFVRFMKEEWSRASVILSGSTLARLFREDQRYPVGRVNRILVGPFCFSEFLEAMGEEHLAKVIRSAVPDISPQRHLRLLELYDDFLKTGGLPAVVLSLAADGDCLEILGQILADYERDFTRIFGEGDASLVKGCMRSVANFVGGVSKNTSGVGMEASHDYLPKRYLFDTGLLRSLRESAVPPIHLLETVDSLVRKSLGGVIENQVAVDFAGQGLPLAGWKKTPSGGEIDFIVKTGASTIPVECKAALRSDRRHWHGILEYLEQFNQNLGIVVSLAPLAETQLPSGKRVLNLPAYLLEQFDALVKKYLKMFEEARRSNE
jgi:predicted AAA+ superfamily ATPase